MIITQTPYRVSFCGGGSDYLEYFMEHEGAVVGTTIDKYCFILAKKTAPGSNFFSRIVHKTVEEVDDNTEIKHPGFHSIINNTEFKDKPLDISHISDVPAQSGLGTSSAFTVGVLNALDVLAGREPYPPADLARRAFNAEKHIMSENVGMQDQMFAAFGGLNVILFDKHKIVCYALNIDKHSKEALEKHVLLFATKQSRHSSQIVGSYINKLSKEKQAHAATTRKLADQACADIFLQKYEDLGATIHKTWMLKRDLSPNVSSPKIDEAYEAGISSGAFGGKLLGGGGGGTLMLIAPPERHAKIIQEMQLLGLPHIPIKFSDRGSYVIHAKR